MKTKKLKILALLVLVIMLISSYSISQVSAATTTISQSTKNYNNFSAGNTWLVKVDLPAGIINDYTFHNLSSNTINVNFSVYSDNNNSIGTLIASKSFANVGTGVQTLQNINLSIPTAGTYWVGVKTDPNFVPYAASGSLLPRMFTDWGYYSGNYCIYFVMNMSDNVVNPPSAPLNLTATPGNAEVNLSWNAVTGATGYNIKRGTTAGGPYNVTVATNITTTTQPDTTVTNGTTYYYVVTALNAGGESGNSNEASATPQVPVTPPLPSGTKAILEITMTNGAVKEYDLTSTDINAFINWYTTRSAGTGPAYFAITKNFIKGPYANRKEYITFDKIFSFEVNEY